MKNNKLIQSELLSPVDSFQETSLNGTLDSKTNKNELHTQVSDPIKRRKFLGMSLLGIAVPDRM
jgi:hypothetical protein